MKIDIHWSLQYRAWVTNRQSMTAEKLKTYFRRWEEYEFFYRLEFEMMTGVQP